MRLPESKDPPQSEETKQASHPDSDGTQIWELWNSENNHDWYIMGSNGKSNCHIRTCVSCKQREENSKKGSK